MNARELFEAQTAADIAHHKERLVWLTAVPPVWSDGEPMDRHVAVQLRKQSERIVVEPWHGYNSCGCEPKCGTKKAD